MDILKTQNIRLTSLGLQINREKVTQAEITKLESVIRTLCAFMPRSNRRPKEVPWYDILGVSPKHYGVRKLAGVYKIISNKKIIYIGYSRNVRERLKSHKYNSRWFVYTDFIAIYWFDDYTDAYRQEQDWIRKYKPKNNRRHGVKSKSSN